MKSDVFSVEQVQKYLYRINNKTVYVFWEIREKQADTSEFPIIKDKSKPYCHGRSGFAFHEYFPCDKSRKIHMETNARTMVLISGKIIGTHCDRRDAWPCHWWKKEGLLYISINPAGSTGYMGRPGNVLWKKRRPMRRQGLQLPLLCIILPSRPCRLLRPSSAYHILVFTACFPHGKPVFRTFDDIWWHLMTPFWKSVFYSDLAHIFEVSKQFINPKKKRYGTRKEPEREA